MNSRVFTEDDGVRSEMTGEQIAALVFPDNPRETRVWLLSPERREVGLNEPLVIHGCETFDVVRKNVEGGFEVSRVDREVGVLRDGGATITVVTKRAAVIYHGLSVKRGLPVEKTDVLVLVPGGYPGQMLDGAVSSQGVAALWTREGEPATKPIDGRSATLRTCELSPTHQRHRAEVGPYPARPSHVSGRTPFMATRRQMTERRRVSLADNAGVGIVRIRAEDLERLQKCLFRRYPNREWGTFFRFGYRRTAWGVLVCFVDVVLPEPGELDRQSDITKFHADYSRHRFTRLLLPRV